MKNQHDKWKTTALPPSTEHATPGRFLRFPAHPHQAVLCNVNPGEHPQKYAEKTISLRVSCTFLFYSDNPTTHFTGQQAFAQFVYNFFLASYDV